MRLALFALFVGALAAAPAPRAQEAAPFILSASANAAGTAELPAGWPLLVTAFACGRTADAPDVPVPAGGWAAGFRLTVTGSDGEPRTWPLTYTTGPRGPLRLAEGCAPAWAWTLGPEATVALAPGLYTLAISVATSTPDQRVAARPVTLRVVAPPPTPTPENEAQRLLLTADAATARGDAAAARAAVETLVQQQPDHAEARRRQAAALGAEGRYIDALLAIEAAIAALPDSVINGPEPPLSLLLARNEWLWAAERATDFVVTRTPKTPDHPTASEGGAHTFRLDGIEGREPTLRRGRVYTFRLNGIPPSSPFYLTTSPRGAGAAPYTDGVEGGPAVGDGTLTFTLGPGTPEVLYYASTTEPWAGWRLHVGDVLTPVEGPPSPDAATPFGLTVPAPNPASGQATLTLTLARDETAQVAVFDVIGRRVALLHDGPLTAGPHRLTLDAAALAPGLYLVRATTPTSAAVQRLTVVR